MLLLNALYNHITKIIMLNLMIFYFVKKNLDKHAIVDTGTKTMFPEYGRGTFIIYAYCFAMYAYGRLFPD